MKKAQLQEQENQDSKLRKLGFPAEHIKKLRRASRTLQRWHELESGTDRGHITRDEQTGKPVFHNYRYKYAQVIPDREKVARAAIRKIVEERNLWQLQRLSTKQQLAHAADARDFEKWVHETSCTGYIQTDPRGAALYIITYKELEGQNIDSVYNRGIAVY